MGYRNGEKDWNMEMGHRNGTQTWDTEIGHVSTRGQKEVGYSPEHLQCHSRESE